MRAWEKIKPDAALQAEIVASISRQAAGRKWQEGYIPMGSTFLNGERWKDEPRMPPRHNGQSANTTPRSENFAEARRLLGIDPAPSPPPTDVYEPTYRVNGDPRD